MTISKINLTRSWNEVEETLTSLNELTDAELISNRESIKDRLKTVLFLLGEHITEKDVEELI